jgi:hypothetical protein
LIKKRDGPIVVVATIGCAREGPDLLRLKSLAQVEIERRRALMFGLDFVKPGEQKVRKGL